MNLVYFVTLVSVLIFVHELGHFLVAKVFGIKVLTFSVGFGPKVLRLRGKETEYCVGLIPLGGFVKMLEWSRHEQILPEDAPRTFDAQPLWRRTLVVMAGPAMNLLFPVALYTLVFSSDHRFTPPTVGIVLPGHVAEGKLYEGDRILSVDDVAVGTFSELQDLVGQSPGKPLQLRVFRNVSYVNVEITPEEVTITNDLDEPAVVGRLGISPNARASVIGISRPDSAAYRAGLRTFDWIMSVGGVPIKRFSDIEKVLGDNHGATVPVTYLRPRALDGTLGGMATIAVFDAGVAALSPDAKAGDLFERTGIESSDLYVSFVPPGSAMAQADLRPGDRITLIDGVEALSWETAREQLLDKKDATHRLTFSRDGARYSSQFELSHQWYEDESGQEHDRYDLRMQHWSPTVPEPPVEHLHPLLYATRRAVSKTLEMQRYIVAGMLDVLRGRVPLSQLSGPLAIYEVAGQEGAKGTDYFLWVMAFISINLGLINLLPIPVLDGGQLMFLLWEALTRRSLPLRVRELASVVGMLMLVGLMSIALKNDVERRWEAISSELHELFG